jgi:hypothetical protein
MNLEVCWKETKKEIYEMGFGASSPKLPPPKLPSKPPSLISEQDLLDAAAQRESMKRRRKGRGDLVVKGTGLEIGPTSTSTTGLSLPSYA